MVAELEATAAEPILVHAPALPLAAMVIEPAPGVIVIPVPAVSEAITGVAPVEPMTSWPLVIEAENPGTPLASVRNTALLAVVISPMTDVAELYKIRLTVVVAGHVVVDHAGVVLAPDCSICLAVAVPARIAKAAAVL